MIVGGSLMAQLRPTSFEDWLSQQKPGYFEVLAPNFPKGASSSAPPTLRSVILSDPSSRKGVGSDAEYVYTPRHWGIFCRLEEQLDRAVGTAVRFRLGSVDYVDYLEGKR